MKRLLFAAAATLVAAASPAIAGGRHCADSWPAEGYATDDYAVVERAVPVARGGVVFHHLAPRYKTIRTRVVVAPAHERTVWRRIDGRRVAVREWVPERTAWRNLKVLVRDRDIVPEEVPTAYESRLSIVRVRPSYAEAYAYGRLPPGDPNQNRIRNIPARFASSASGPEMIRPLPVVRFVENPCR